MQTPNLSSKYRRVPFENRPWIRNRYWDLLSKQTILHVDVFCLGYHDQYWLIFDVRAGGKHRRAVDIVDITDGAWTPTEEGPHFNARPVYWSWGTRHLFNAVHHRALTQASAYLREPYSSVSPLFHYVRVLDSEPMRGIANHWRYGDQQATQY